MQFKMHSLDEPMQDPMEENRLNAPPQDSDNTDDEAYRERTNIQPSNNIGKKDKTGSTEVFSKKKDERRIASASVRPTKSMVVPTQDGGMRSPKRMSQDRLETEGAWSKKKVKTKVKAKYGSQSSQGKGYGRNATFTKTSSQPQGLIGRNTQFRLNFS
jgi:hypothetical protein